MIKLRIPVLGFLLGLLAICAPTSNGQDRATLYSINKHRGEQKVFCINFRSGVTGYSPTPCDLRYGALYVRDELDWLESYALDGHRSVIKDLGLLNWDQAFKVPVVQPLPELQPGEQRHFTVDASGADGADGAPGAPARDGVDSDGVLRPKAKPATVPAKLPAAVRPKHDGKIRVDPVFVKAIAGHMYVIRVVNETDDFYVLFRVEEIERGSKCTISWRMVPAPSADIAQAKK